MYERKFNIFFKFCLNFLMFCKERKKRSGFYFCGKVNFPLEFCYYFENDLDVRKSIKNLLKVSK